MEKRLGVSGSSLSGWSAKFVKVLEFRIASTSIIIVSRMSTERRLDPRTAKTVHLELWTTRYRMPPIWGPYGGIKIHAVLTTARALKILSLSKILPDFFSSSEAPASVFPLSMYNKICWHIRQLNHRYAFRKVSVFMSRHCLDRVLKWTARIARHVKITS